MVQNELTKNAKGVALAHGADLVGIVKVGDLPEHTESIIRILPTAQSLMIVVSKHNLAAISSANNQVAQFDTIHTYDACARAAHEACRFLESEGFSSVAVPAFIPLDMEKPKYGMRGEICWRRAGVRAGLGSYGENGLLITKEYGAAIRISGLITSSDLKAGSPLQEDVCDHCLECINACPAGALSGEGKINKKLCGDAIFKFGFRFFNDLIQGLIRKQPSEIEEIIEGQGLLEMWQTFMTGNYYYCFQCQSQCPATKLLR
ncbi:MAG: epoxyqueuosine reductase [Deltaproteobacteria bacterium]|jgi:epoxyqueuosine reductase|nr:epoxyqueuosine reductase [Deltaproteobacteria bacterium]MBT4267379.1 epoxyqueuosine reductase [Deltaproteobacteria bacterium]MBT4642028.1 epoxyqueuosine reductase [Deltaproteobacteria bacterium]MBT6499928.1 epoxyqueuosine reductase [Deltaproteobacteria bacterium]MBT6612800.1 epoxyqueuosine reductase [Deltaproteobacteria bacterium]